MDLYGPNEHVKLVVSWILHIVPYICYISLPHVNMEILLLLYPSQ